MAQVGLIQTDHEMTKADAKELMKLYDGLQVEISNGPKKLVIMVQNSKTCICVGVLTHQNGW